MAHSLKYDCILYIFFFLQFRDSSTIPFDVTSEDKLDDQDFLDDNPDQDPEPCIVKGVISAHTYVCCPKKCKNYRNINFTKFVLICITLSWVGINF